MPDINFQAFTNDFKAHVNVLSSPIGVSLPTIPDAANKYQIQIHRCLAIWDTGATNSVISSDVVKQLSLKPISKAEAHTANGMRLFDVYLVNIYLPNNVMFGAVRVTETESLTGGASALIGMDIIGSGDFAVTNFNGVTKMSYRNPSTKIIDFVSDWNKLTADQQKKLTKSEKQKIKAQRKLERKNRKKGRSSN